LDQERLGDDPDDLLHKQRGARQQPARVGPRSDRPRCRAGAGSCRATTRARRRARSPTSRVQRPRTASRPAVGDPSAGGEERDVAGRPLGQGQDRLGEEAGLENLPRRLRQDEVDRLFGAKLPSPFKARGWDADKVGRLLRSSFLLAAWSTGLPQ
jgi:hypothetical protein